MAAGVSQPWALATGQALLPVLQPKVQVSYRRRAKEVRFGFDSRHDRNRVAAARSAPAASNHRLSQQGAAAAAQPSSAPPAQSPAPAGSPERVHRMGLGVYLDALAFYTPSDERETESNIDHVSPRLQHAISAVVLSHPPRSSCTTCAHIRQISVYARSLCD